MTSPRVALLDSGVFLAHPHLEGAAIRTLLLVDEGGWRCAPGDGDVTGHGTAAAAALLGRVPDVDLLSLRVLDAELRCTHAALAEGIRLAAREGARIINLSLGSRAPEARAPLEAAVREAAREGAICVASAHPRGATLWPADGAGVISATTHRSCPRAEHYLVEGPLPRFLAHGWPRPIDGRPPTDNLFGSSFAAVQITARVVEILRRDPDLDFEGVVQRLRDQATGTWSAA